ncbi:AsmA-like C-terminal domain-containing protein [Geomobilimonas luticola]|uniref:YhdP family protein n=1 Tax=Geomobilimonas luticola TaxID=1114878 RepID=UPI001FE52A61|nr:AsmA-like C-terminal domain-containing protein [Geomobilimonas luticola]
MRLIPKKSYLLASLALLLLMALAATLILPRLLHLDSYRDQILAQVQQSLSRQVSYETGEFSYHIFPTFTFTKVVVKEKDGTSTFIGADRLVIKVALLPLLKKKIVLRDLVLEKPAVELVRDRTGRLNISDLLEERPEGVPLQIRGVQLQKGRIRFTDLAVAPQGVVTLLEDTDLNLDHIGRGKTCTIKIATTVLDNGQKGSLSLTGKATIPSKGKPASDTTVNISVKGKNLDATPYWPYYSGYVPFRQVLARVDLDSTFKGKLADFTSRGKIRIAGLRFDYPQVFHAVLTPKDLHFSYDMAVTPREVNVKELDFTVDALNVKGSCSIGDIHTSDPRITARAVTSQFNLQYFAQYIPYGIIVKDTADFIEQHIKGGIYKLDDGRLNGRISQILHMEQGTNYDVLFIKGRVQQGVVSYGPQIPAFNGISGTLEMRGKNFNLIGMSGNFGTSPFTLDGKITDYPLNTPSGYPFTMSMTPHQAEVAWLLGPERGKKLSYSGDAPLRLTGEGFTSGYRLTGEWNLGQASYSYPDMISKPMGRANILSVAGTISKQEARISLLRYRLAPMDLAISAVYRYTDSPRLELAFKSNPFPLQEVAGMLPKVHTYQPVGSLQASVRATSQGKSIDDLSWSGSVAFNGFAFKPAETVRPVSNLSGTINFNGDSLETSQLTARLGTSTIYGKGKLVGFGNPTLNLSFFSPLLDMADLGFGVPRKEVKLTGVEGSIDLKNHNLQIKSLSTKLNNTSLNVRGTVQDLRNPKLDLTVASTYLDVDDIILLAELEPLKKANTPRTRLALNARVDANAGRFADFPFQQLHTDVHYENRILYLQQTEMAAFGGAIAGKARIDFGMDDAPRYQVNYTIDNASADQLARAIGMKQQEIMGNLSMQGDLTAKGKTADEILRTSLGSTRIHVEKGLLRKFATLSKVFSILNVSQLLKLQLPDMVSGGMPFNDITGTLAVSDGIVSTRDLFIKSNAINISVVGSINLVREELDVTIGTQPLQTVDKVVSRIPIVGWVLTGKERTLVSAYFVAKGKINDPDVTAIPIDSMAKGVFDIFKRIFQLPAKLITNTGEVIMGK